MDFFKSAIFNLIFSDHWSHFNWPINELWSMIIVSLFLWSGELISGCNSFPSDVWNRNGIHLIPKVHCISNGTALYGTGWRPMSRKDELLFLGGLRRGRWNIWRVFQWQIHIIASYLKLAKILHCFQTSPVHHHVRVFTFFGTIYGVVSALQEFLWMMLNDMEQANNIPVLFCLQWWGFHVISSFLSVQWTPPGIIIISILVSDLIAKPRFRSTFAVVVGWRKAAAAATFSVIIKFMDILQVLVLCVHFIRYKCQLWLQGLLIYGLRKCEFVQCILKPTNLFVVLREWMATCN